MTEDNTETRIEIDLTDDEKSLRWMDSGPEDVRERFSEWSDEKTRRKMQDMVSDAMTQESSYEDVATVGELQEILNEVSEEHGDDVEVTVPRSDGFRVPTHPTLIVDSDGWATLELTHDHESR